MWNSSDLVEGQDYFLSLCQKTSGTRYFSLHSIGETLCDEAVFQTEIVPYELLDKRDFIEIAKTVTLINGDKFYVDAHGVWLSVRECEAIDDDLEEDQVPWVNGLPPNLAPR